MPDRSQRVIPPNLVGVARAATAFRPGRHQAS
jgi:hypothetical protein